jgi:hypothetical protein
MITRDNMLQFMRVRQPHNLTEEEEKGGFNRGVCGGYF